MVSRNRLLAVGSATALAYFMLHINKKEENTGRLDARTDPAAEEATYTTEDVSDVESIIGRSRFLFRQMDEGEPAFGLIPAHELSDEQRALLSKVKGYRVIDADLYFTIKDEEFLKFIADATASVSTSTIVTAISTLNKIYSEEVCMARSGQKIPFGTLLETHWEYRSSEYYKEGGERGTRGTLSIRSHLGPPPYANIKSGLMTARRIDIEGSGSNHFKKAKLTVGNVYPKQQVGKGELLTVASDRQLSSTDSMFPLELSERAVLSNNEAKSLSFLAPLAPLTNHLRRLSSPQHSVIILRRK